MTITSLSNESAELIVKRSKFIAYSFMIEGEEEAQAILEDLKRRYIDATHVCYAYIADEKGLIYKCYDDGEPSATAGLPILGVIKNNGYVKTMIAVIRYFGGTKLGVGGLVKAYTDSALLVEQKAKKIQRTLSKIYSANLDYTMFKKVSGLLNAEAKILSAEYGDSVTFKFAIKEEATLYKIVSVCSGKFDCVFEKECYIEL